MYALVLIKQGPWFFEKLEQRDKKRGWRLVITNFGSNVFNLYSLIFWLLLLNQRVHLDET